MQFLRFVVAGGINTALTYGFYLLLLPLFGYLAAYSVAYVVGIVLSYWLNSVFVFHEPLNWPALARFPLVYVVQYLLTAALLWVFVDALGVGERVAPLFAVAVTVPVTFLVTRIVLQGSQRAK